MVLAEYLDRTSPASIPITEAEAEAMLPGFVGSNDFMWFDVAGASFKGGPAKLAAALKKAYGGAPKVVAPLPPWLEAKLNRWQLKRHQGSSTSFC